MDEKFFVAGLPPLIDAYKSVRRVEEAQNRNVDVKMHNGLKYINNCIFMSTETKYYPVVMLPFSNHLTPYADKNEHNNPKISISID